MEAWYRQQPYFTQDKLDMIKDWMRPDYVNLIELQEFRDAS